MSDAGLLRGLRVTGVAHGGHCVARHEGRVVFVRHALPGEVVDVQLTGAGGGGRYLFGDAVAVLAAAAGRRPAPCPVAGPAGCGGCDWQHAVPELQRDLKAAVLTEQLRRLGGVDRSVPVHAVPGDDAGLSWRTRVRYSVAPDGRLGFRRHASHDVQAVPFCVIAHPAVRSAADPAADWRPAREVVVAAGDDSAVVRVEPTRTPAGSTHCTAVGRRWEIPADGFWQVHPGAPEALAAAVAAAPGMAHAAVVWDLYAGVGLFTGALARPGRVVHAVESAAAAVAAARRNLAGVPGAVVHRADVRRWLEAAPPRAGDVAAVVLDPPRRGAGRRVLAAVTRSAARTVVHVACDPAALGRDIGLLRESGWQLDSVTGFDLFPNTHHVEAVAVLTR